MFEFKPFVEHRGFREFYVCRIDSNLIVLYIY